MMVGKKHFAAAQVGTVEIVPLVGCLTPPVRPRRSPGIPVDLRKLKVARFIRLKVKVPARPTPAVRCGDQAAFHGMMVNVIHRPVKLVQASHVPVVTGTFLPETKRRVVWPVAHAEFFVTVHHKGIKPTKNSPVVHVPT